MSNLLTSYIRLKKIRRDQWLSLEQLQFMQQKKLILLINHAYYNTKYYKNLFDSTGVKPDDIKSVHDLKKIPITTKLKLQELSDKEKLAVGYEAEKCIKIKTSGSTGIPLNLYFSKDDKARIRLYILRTNYECGRRYFDKVATIAGSNYEDRLWFQKFGLMKRLFIPADMEVNKQIEILRQFSPKQIIGLPSAIKRIVEVMKERSLNTIRPRFIKTGGEVLDDETRAFIADVFKAEVFDTYGAYECGYIAWECKEHIGYHVNIDSLVVEIIREDGKEALPGEMGEVVVTNLNVYAMPIIRYKLGDFCMVTDEKCSCGRGLPLIKKIVGRSDDFIILPSGRYIQPAIFRRIMRSIRGIKQFKIIQESEQEIVVKIVKGNDFQETSIPVIEEKFRRELEMGGRVYIDLVETLGIDPSGKFSSVISRVKRNSRQTVAGKQ